MDKLKQILIESYKCLKEQEITIESDDHDIEDALDDLISVNDERDKINAVLTALDAVLNEFDNIDEIPPVNLSSAGVRAAFWVGHWNGRLEAEEKSRMS